MIAYYSRRYLMTSAAMLLLLIQFLVFFVPVQCEAIELKGGGASFAAEWITRCWLEFSSQRAGRATPQTTLNYRVTGSSIGKKWIKQELGTREYPNIAFAGSDSELNENDYATHPNLQMFPLVGGAIVVVYNIPEAEHLYLSVATLVGIFSGKIRTWDDRNVTFLNNRSAQPNKPITVIAHRDGSGSTEVFTAGLVAADDWWRSEVGIIKSPALVQPEGPSSNWPENGPKLFAQGGGGMAGIIASIPYSIGYVALADAKVWQLRVAHIINSYGESVELDEIPMGVQAAMDHYAEQFSQRLTVQLVNAPTQDAYPLSTFTYFIVNMTTHPEISCDDIKIMLQFFRFIHSPAVDTITSQLSMVGLSKTVADRVEKQVFRNLKCGGAFVDDLIDIDLRNMRQSQFPTQTVIIVVFFAFFMVVIVGFMMLWRQKQQEHGKSTWLISSDDIELLRLFSNLGSASTTTINTQKTDKSGGNERRIMAYKDASKDSFYGVYQFCKLNEVGTILFPPLGVQDSPTKHPKDYSKSTAHILQKYITGMSHENITKLWGITNFLPENHIYHIYELNGKTSLHGMLAFNPYDLDMNVKLSLARDICAGLSYLHRNNILHGIFDSWNCYLTKNWTVRVTNWLQTTLSGLESDSGAMVPTSELFTNGDIVFYKRLLFRHMDLHSTKNVPPIGVNHDLYSLGMTLIEVFTRELPYNYLVSADETDWESVYETVVIKGIAGRPKYDSNMMSDELHKLINDLIGSQLQFGSMEKVWIQLGTVKSAAAGGGIVEALMSAMESYMEKLEERVEERTDELGIISKQMEELLFRMLPKEVALSLRAGHQVEPQHYGQASVYFSDIVQFTSLCAESSAMQVITFLNELYSTFDNIIDLWDVYKVETIGDAYMVVSGCPRKNGNNHAEQIVQMSMQIVQSAMGFKIHHNPRRELKIRVGLCSGSIMAGVVGQKMPRYCLFGDTVNTASRMETASGPNKIHAAKSTIDILNEHFPTKFTIVSRGLIEIKGKGMMETYWIKHPMEFVPLNRTRGPSLLKNKRQSKSDHSSVIDDMSEIGD